MCSRLRTGSAWIPSSPSRLVTVVERRSRTSSASAAASPRGASSDFRIESGRPASLPGV